MPLLNCISTDTGFAAAFLAAGLVLGASFFSAFLGFACEAVSFFASAVLAGSAFVFAGFLAGAFLAGFSAFLSCTASTGLTSATASAFTGSLTTVFSTVFLPFPFATGFSAFEAVSTGFASKAVSFFTGASIASFATVFLLFLGVVFSAEAAVAVVFFAFAITIPPSD